MIFELYSKVMMVLSDGWQKDNESQTQILLEVVMKIFGTQDLWYFFQHWYFWTIAVHFCWMKGCIIKSYWNQKPTTRNMGLEFKRNGYDVVVLLQEFLPILNFQFFIILKRLLIIVTKGEYYNTEKNIFNYAILLIAWW